MKKLLLVLFVFAFYNAIAQLEVKPYSFKEVPGFVNINPDENYQTDDNNLPFAVIKVRTENINDKQRRELKFSGNAGTFIMLEYKDGEVWVYLTAQYADYLKISHPDFSSIEFTLPYDLKPKCGYEMTLVNKAEVISNGWASLTITTTPDNGADITLNGRPLNQTTPYTNNMIPAGKYEVIVSKERFKTTTNTIDINDGENKVVNINMPYLYGDLSISSEPAGAIVFIDSNNYGTTPLNLNQTIIVGKHDIRFEKAGCATLIKQFVVDENSTLVIYEKLETGRDILITTDRKGDNIYVDGNYVGVTPITITMSFDKHIIKAVRENKESTKQIILSPDNNESKVHIVFKYGYINGVFSVSANKKVKFSRGNLQYQASTNTWRFAENQWDYVGSERRADKADSGGTVIGSSNHMVSSSYNGWIDLFGWGTSGYKGKYPYINYSSIDYGDGDNNISGTNYDWGIYNNISNGDNKKWRALTKDEWGYIFDGRQTSSGKRFAKAVVTGINGVILLPDNWSSRYYDLNDINNHNSNFSNNIITQNDWINKLEPYGAVFLPASGRREGSYFSFIGLIGHYWSSTAYNSYMAYYVFISDNHSLKTDQIFYRDLGLCVRLVYDVE